MLLALLPLLLPPSSSAAAAKVPSYPHCRKVTGNKNPEDEETVPCYSGLCLAEKCEERFFAHFSLDSFLNRFDRWQKRS